MPRGAEPRAAARLTPPGGLALCGARVFTGDGFLEHHAAVLQGGRITALPPRDALPPGQAAQVLDGGLLVPGFVDAQVNGGGGVLFNQVRTPEGAAAIAAAHARFGTTALLPTFITGAPAEQAEAVAAVRACLAAGVPGVVGVHLEGPFIAAARTGAHDPALIRSLTDADVAELLGTGLATVVLTLAPETVSGAHIRRLVAGGVVVSLGHSDAAYHTAMAAAEAGATGVTHLFNAMSPIGHRAPGLAGAALEHGGLWAGVIADTHHVDPAVLRLALRAKRGPGRLFLVSDAMPPAGSTSDEFVLGGRTVTRWAGRLTLADGTLAGSDLTMDGAVRAAVRVLELPLAEALRMASLYPAQWLGLAGERGRLAEGFRADLVHLDEALQVQQVWIAGVAVR